LQAPSEVFANVRFFFRDPHVGLWLALLGLAAVEVLRRLALARRREDRRATVLIGAMLLAALGLYATDGEFGRRMPFFAILPLWALSASALSAALHVGIGAAGARRWLTVPAGGLFLAGLGVLAAALLTPFGESLKGSLVFYGFIEPRHLAAAEFATANSVADDRFLAYPFSFGWWLAGAAGRDASAVGRFTDTEQNRQSAVAEQILAGDHILSNGALLIGDAFPLESAGTPEIWLTLPDLGERLPIMFFDDSATLLIASGPAGILRYRALTNLERTLVVTEEPDLLRLEKTFTDADLRLTQRTELAPGRYNWSVEYRAADAERAVVQLTIPLVFTYAPEVIIEDTGMLLVRHLLSDHSGLRYEALVELRLTGRNAKVSLSSVTRLLSPAGDERQVTVAVEPWAPDFGVRLDFRVLSLRSLSAGRPGTVGLETPVESTLEYTRADQLSRNNSIDYVALDLQPSPARLPALPGAIDARLRTSPAFELWYARDGIAFYHVQQTPWVVDFANAAEAPRFVEVEAFAQPSRWVGPGVSEVVVREGEVLQRTRTVVSGEVAHRPEQWSGLIFAAPSLDWTGTDDFAVQFRWGSLAGLEELAVGFADDEDRRWAWRIPAGAALPLRDGWLAWFMSRGEATRQDEGFDWDRIAQIFVTALAAPDAYPPRTELEIAFIGVVER
ncbi:MAG: hypothetical protein IIB19_07760, partial [Chloroflexi bacterium]|nr:hypothetical protein [Chloroflexota bacterium]